VYFASGLALMLVKYAVDAAAVWLVTRPGVVPTRRGAGNSGWLRYRTVARAWKAAPGTRST